MPSSWYVICLFHIDTNKYIHNNNLLYYFLLKKTCMFAHASSFSFRSFFIFYFLFLIFLKALDGSVGAYIFLFTYRVLMTMVFLPTFVGFVLESFARNLEYIEKNGFGEDNDDDPIADLRAIRAAKEQEQVRGESKYILSFFLSYYEFLIFTCIFYHLV